MHILSASLPQMLVVYNSASLLAPDNIAQKCVNVKTSVHKKEERGETSTLVHVNVSLLADDVGETAADTLDGAHSVHHLLPAIDVGTKDTQNVLEIATILDDESLCMKKKTQHVKLLAVVSMHNP